MLFNKLTDDIFLPLSGKNRQIYQAVMLELANLFFDEDLIDPFIPRDLVRSSIENAVIRLGVRRWEPEDDETETESEQLIPRSSAEYASRIYRRLLKTGWLEEEQRIYKSYVLLSPANSFLLRTLVSIANLEKRSYGGAVLNVLSSLEAAIADPSGRGITLSEAAQTAVDFSAHLTDMMLGLRELKNNLSQTNNPQEIVKNFFDRFVEHILVSDYKTLKTKNNPFRFRQQILSLLRELQFDTSKLEQFIMHYQQQHETDIHNAEMLVHRHINLIIRIFESVDQRLAVIDDFRYRLEKRVSDTVRYMDKTTPGMASRLSRIISDVSQKDGREIPPITTLDSISFIAPSSIRAPIKKRLLSEPRVITQSEVDPKVLQIRQLFKEYKERREVRVDKIQDYLERHFIGKNQVKSSEFTIESIEDYICFSYIRHLKSLGKKARREMNQYHIEFEEKYINVADMVECRAFNITKNKQEKEVANAW